MRSLRVENGTRSYAAAEKLSLPAVEEIVQRTGLSIAGPGLTIEALRLEIGAGRFWLSTLRSMSSKAQRAARRKELKSLIVRSNTYRDLLNDVSRYDPVEHVDGVIAGIGRLVESAHAQLHKKPFVDLTDGVMAWFVGEYLKEIFENFFDRPATGTRDAFNNPSSHFHRFAMASIQALEIEKSYGGSYSLETVAAYLKRAKVEARTPL
jgi:hypothetical protein